MPLAWNAPNGTAKMAGPQMELNQGGRMDVEGQGQGGPLLDTRLLYRTAGSSGEVSSAISSYAKGWSRFPSRPALTVLVQLPRAEVQRDFLCPNRKASARRLELYFIIKNTGWRSAAQLFTSLSIFFPTKAQPVVLEHLCNIASPLKRPRETHQGEPRTKRQPSHKYFIYFFWLSCPCPTKDGFKSRHTFLESCGMGNSWDEQREAEVCLSRSSLQTKLRLGMIRKAAAGDETRLFG